MKSIQEYEALQSEAQQYGQAAAQEKAAVEMELERLSHLVFSFQEKIARVGEPPGLCLLCL